ncbi:MAG: hypothetical protein JXQ83_01090 [Candidatus Glassbacteria bacterium]|nr:hypothetical protein [Candidatus Glassbacteria bacterium]
MKPGIILVKKFRGKPPRSMEPLGYRRQLTWPEYARVRRGAAPACSADKWLIYCRGGRVFFRRSGNGTLVYRVKFSQKGRGFEAVEAHVNADREQLDPLPQQYECRMLDYLIDRLLLGREAAFPVPEGTDLERAAVLERIWMGDAAAGSAS